MAAPILLLGGFSTPCQEYGKEGFGFQPMNAMPRVWHLKFANHPLNHWAGSPISSPMPRQEKANEVEKLNLNWSPNRISASVFQLKSPLFKREPPVRSLFKSSH